MPVQSSIGTVLSVSANEPATEDQVGYEALTWTEVGEVSDHGEWGPQYAVNEHTPVKTGITKKLKGALNQGSMNLQTARVPTDAGQTILRDGCNGANKFQRHSFKVALQDGTVQYMMGMIFSYTTNVGGASSVTQAAIGIEIDSEIVEV